MHRADPPARLEDGYVEADDHGFHTLGPSSQVKRASS